ncbi:conserved hypothetical protein [Ricinus communis]|uniref:Uncharacterized protein n=1 Tax=Ricinus communis TaxID=3988 RepID=B9SV50_RICCO|nr:conserved hypothetical protein [Ricinus communis]
MAFTTIVRRASASVLPFARSISARRTFHSAISAAIGVEKQSLGHKVDHRQLFLPFSRFSTASISKKSAEESLIRVLESEIDCALEPTDVSSSMS